MKALVVDDSRVTRRILTGVLRHECGILEVVEATDGQEAIDCAGADTFDVILLDWDMPNVTGIEALTALRASGNKTPIIMVTAQRDKIRIVEAIHAGANNYVVKPFRPSTVDRKIRQVLENHHHLTKSQRTKKALIVDDSATVRKLLHTTLQKHCGFQVVIEADDGDTALDATHKASFDIILLDWNMPKVSGIEVLRKIRKHDKRTPVLMVTGETDDAHVMKAFDAGATNYLVKPFKAPALVVKVQQVLHTTD
ncbi:MAG: response regulator [bacterium]|nr:response regulator [bacterium]